MSELIFTNELSMENFPIKKVGTPTLVEDLATKEYVDGMAHKFFTDWNVFVGDGTTKEFSLTRNATSGVRSVLVLVGGLLQKPTFTGISTPSFDVDNSSGTSKIVFSEAPPINSNVQVYIK